MQHGRAGFVPALFFCTGLVSQPAAQVLRQRASILLPAGAGTAGRSDLPDTRIGFPLYKSARFWAIIFAFSRGPVPMRVFG